MRQQLPPPPPGYEKSTLIDPNVASAPRASGIPSSSPSSFDPGDIVPTPPPGSSSINIPEMLGLANTDQSMMRKVQAQATAQHPGAGWLTTGVSEALAPFSLMNAQDQWQVPPVISGLGHMLYENATTEHPIDLARQRLAGVIEPFQQMVTGDTQARAEGLGKIVSQVLAGWLGGEAIEGIGGMKGTSVPRGTPPPEPFVKGTGVPETGPPTGQPGASKMPSGAIDVPYTIKARKAIGPGEPTPPPKALPPGEGHYVPGGGTVPIKPEEPLPAHYAKKPAETQPSQPGTMGIKRNLQAKEGSIPARKEQTVTPTHVPHVSARDTSTGLFRKMTEEEHNAFIDKEVAKRSNIGKGETEPVKSPAPPPKSTVSPIKAQQGLTSGGKSTGSNLKRSSGFVRGGGVAETGEGIPTGQPKGSKFTGKASVKPTSPPKKGKQ